MPERSLWKITIDDGGSVNLVPTTDDPLVNDVIRSSGIQKRTYLSVTETGKVIRLSGTEKEIVEAEELIVGKFEKIVNLLHRIAGN